MGKKPTFVWGRVFNTIIVIILVDVIVIVVVVVIGFESHFLKGKSKIRIWGRFVSF